MNAAERLWRALRKRDWAAARAQFHPTAVIERPHGDVHMGPDEYVGDVRERLHDRPVQVRRVVSDGHRVAVEAQVGDARWAGFYDLHDGLIAGAVELWVGEAG